MNERCPEGFCVLGGARGLKRRPLAPHPLPRSVAQQQKA